MQKYLLNEPMVVELLKHHKIGIVDGGARGFLFPPFRLVNKDIIKLLRFEPDAAATILNNSDLDLVFNKALWKEKTQININIAVEPSSSSVYPFNVELQQHIDPLKATRQTAKVVEVEAISLDELVAENPTLKIDFIKLDIHAAEYEVLQGAKNVLQNTLGLLIESWILPVHRGQKVRANVEALAYDNGFYVFEEYARASWGRLDKQFAKRQTVALDTLFFKDPLLDNNVATEADAIKLIGMADLFGHPAFAMQLSTFFYEKQIINKTFFECANAILKTKRITWKEKLVMKLERLLDDYSNCAFR
jgi:FkbM family methyltransferase